MADFNHTRIFCGNEPKSEKSILAMHCDWSAYRNWLSSPACDEMNEDEFSLHVVALTCLERRIVRATSVTAQELAAQIDVLSSSGEDTSYHDEMRTLIGRAATHGDERIAA